MSDCTIIIARDINSSGTKLTIKLCKELNKPYIIITEELKGLTLHEMCMLLYLKLKDDKVEIINVAGNRESVAPGIQDFSYRVIKELCEIMYIVNTK